MSQLYKCARPDFETFASWTPESGRRVRPAGSFPFVKWPDGHWCIEANLFLLDRLDRGYSFSPRGGTLGTYASELTSLIRYCSDKGKKFIELKDGDFSECVEQLYRDTKLRHGIKVKRNNRTTVRTIACVWLDFLSFVGELCGNGLFVARGGVINAYLSNTEPSTGTRGTRRTGWVHHSLGSPDPYNYRMPLSDEQLKRLRAAAREVSRSQFARQRRLVMLELFDVVGLRRIEASRLTVGDVQRAILEKNSLLARLNGGEVDLPPAMLSFWKAKSRRRRSSPADIERERTDESSKRMVPIPAVTLQFFSEYLFRLQRIMRRLGLPYGPATPFFVNFERGRGFGRALMPNWFTAEFFRLRRAAGISGPASPHMARHRYIVRELIRLIQEFRLENMDDFRRALLDAKGFVDRLRQVTGNSAKGLEPYIQLAFDELTGMETAVGRVHVRREVDALDAAQKRYAMAVASGDDPAQAGQELARAVEAFRAAIGRAQ